MEGSDSIAPLKEFRSWTQLVAVVQNADVYQYLQAWILPILGRHVRRINNITLYVKGWLCILMSFYVNFVADAWVQPNRCVPAQTVPAIVLNACGRAPLAGGLNAWYENNMEGVARGEAFWFTGLSHVELRTHFWLGTKWRFTPKRPGESCANCLATGWPQLVEKIPTLGLSPNTDVELAISAHLKKTLETDNVTVRAQDRYRGGDSFFRAQGSRIFRLASKIPSPNLPQIPC